MLKTLENEIKIGQLLKQEFEYCQWKWGRFQSLLERTDAEIQLKEKTIQQFKETKLEETSYKSEQTQLDNAKKSKIVFHQLSKELEQRMDVLANPTTQVVEQKKKDLDALVNDVESLIGEERRPLREHIYALLRKFHAESDTFTDSAQLNMILMGPAGSGKTTAAQVYGRSLSRIGIFLHSQVQLKTRVDLVAEYVGQTAPKTRAVLTGALETVLFVDEAYTLTSCPGEKEDSYGLEAVQAMLDFLTEYQGLFAMIVAGYQPQMETCFLPKNDGLPRRFPTRIVLDRYSAEDLFDILVKRLNKRKSGQALLKDQGPTIKEWIFLKNQDNVFTNQAGDMQILADALLDAPFHLPSNTPNAQVVSHAFQTFLTMKNFKPLQKPAPTRARLSHQQSSFSLVQAIETKQPFSHPSTGLRYMWQNIHTFVLPLEMHTYARPLLNQLFPNGSEGFELVDVWEYKRQPTSGAPPRRYIPGGRPTGLPPDPGASANALPPDPKTSGAAGLKDGPLGPSGGTGAPAPGLLGPSGGTGAEPPAPSWGMGSAASELPKPDDFESLKQLGTWMGQVGSFQHPTINNLKVDWKAEIVVQPFMFKLKTTQINISIAPHEKWPTAEAAQDAWKQIHYQLSTNSKGRIFLSFPLNVVFDQPVEQEKPKKKWKFFTLPDKPVEPTVCNDFKDRSSARRFNEGGGRYCVYPPIVEIVLHVPSEPVYFASQATVPVSTTEISRRHLWQKVYTSLMHTPEGRWVLGHAPQVKFDTIWQDRSKSVDGPENVHDDGIPRPGDFFS